MSIGHKQKVILGGPNNSLKTSEPLAIATPGTLTYAVNIVRFFNTVTGDCRLACTKERDKKGRIKRWYYMTSPCGDHMSKEQC